jgi:hypothetical protein
MTRPLDFTGSPGFATNMATEDLDRSHIESLDRILHGEWALGRNIVLAWVPCVKGMEVLIIPHYTISEFIATTDHEADNPASYLDNTDSFMRQPMNVIEDVIGGSKKRDDRELAQLSKILGYPSKHIDLPFTPGTEVPYEIVESVVKRYSISFVEDRAVALFDIVGFSLLSPLDQVTQLNSLALSVNSAHAKMLSNDIYIRFARTTTGDGFYIWNRDHSIQANVNLYHLMHLVLADNAIARAKSSHKTTPLLRTAFHVGGYYEFYQSEGLSPTIYSYIVGDVTIELARMVEQALPGQVLVGEFWIPIPDGDIGLVKKIDTVDFIDKTQETLSSLNGLVLSGDTIDSINCYLTGDRVENLAFAVRKYIIVDKHGKGRNVYNAKVNIYRKGTEPVFLGLPTSKLGPFNASTGGFVALRGRAPDDNLTQTTPG